MIVASLWGGVFLILVAVLVAARVFLLELKSTCQICGNLLFNLWLISSCFMWLSLGSLHKQRKRFMLVC